MMTPVLLAGVNKDNAIHELIPTGSSVAEALVIFGALFLVSLAVFAWAFFSVTRRHRHSRHHPTPAPKAAPENAHDLKSASRSHRRRHRHVEDFPRNPTLAEVGGLPPIRTKEPPPPLA
jgi:hypothetical protein